MTQINLLAWRDELNLQRKKKFQWCCVGMVIFAGLWVALEWMYVNHKCYQQIQINQNIMDENQRLEVHLKPLSGMQKEYHAVMERIQLIHALQGQRPITVRLVDELVRVVPTQMYLTKFARTNNQFVIEGRAENPNRVAELLRHLDASPWYRNAVMNSFIAEISPDNQQHEGTFNPEIAYGQFIVQVDLSDMAVMATQIPLPESAKQ